MQTIKLGVSGDAGSFSEEAAMLYAKNKNLNPNLEYLIDMEGVLKAIHEGDIDIGILPVVNLRGGLVRMAFDAMGKYQFKVQDELWMQVQQCLLTQKETDNANIARIVSHYQALAQCKDYLQKHYPQVELIEWQDTALAAKELSLNKLAANTAVIAPRRAAELYGLNVTANNIQDANPNLTAFIIVTAR